MKNAVFGAAIAALLMPSTVFAGWWLSPSNQYCYSQDELNSSGNYHASGNVNGVLGEYYCADSWSFSMAPSLEDGDSVTGGIHAWDGMGYDYEVGQYGEDEVSCYTPGQLAKASRAEASGHTTELLPGFECASVWEFSGEPPEMVLYGVVHKY